MLGFCSSFSTLSAYFRYRLNGFFFLYQHSDRKKKNSEEGHRRVRGREGKGEHERERKKESVVIDSSYITVIYSNRRAGLKLFRVWLCGIVMRYEATQRILKRQGVRKFKFNSNNNSIICTHIHTKKVQYVLWVYLLLCLY